MINSFFFNKIELAAFFLMESKLCKINFPNNFEIPKNLNLGILKDFRFGNLVEKQLTLR
jgi:hypothetical protein